ncbi:MAG TPA: hypothetical protein VI197_17835 [Polyangiaceae bacterium]
MTSIFAGGWSGLAAGVVALSWAVPASAAECAGDADCPKGFTCEVSESVACPDVPACEDGESCEDKAADCVAEEYRSCVSIDCSADSDCADGMVCETIQHERCSTPGAPAADPGTEPDSDADPLPPDAAPPESSCEVEERNYCVPKYLLPCEAAVDCGAGFTCEMTLEQCSCSSPSASTSGGSGSMPGGEGSGGNAGDSERPASPPPDGEDDGANDGCVCEPVDGPAYCELVVTECSANSDCPSGMSCEDNPEGSCSCTPEGGVECTADPEKICLPPYVDYAGGVIEEDGLGSDPTSNPEEPPRGEDDDSNDADGSSDESSESGDGCSVAAVGVPAGAWASLGLMLGAALLGRRRRSAR